jgi:Fe-S-cluster containining protein
MESEEAVVTCPGYCCIDIGPIQFDDEYLTLEKLEELARDPQRTLARFFLRRMFVPLGKDAKGADHFGCRFFEPRERRCTIYANRPGMCRDFPYGNRCQLCTYDDAHPDVPGVLRAEYEDPERLSAFLQGRLSAPP